MLLVLSQKVIELISFVLSNPLSSVEDNTEQKVCQHTSPSSVCGSVVQVEHFVGLLSHVQDADRLKCATSVVHQADQACRRLISEAMKTARGQLRYCIL